MISVETMNRIKLNTLWTQVTEKLNLNKNYFSKKILHSLYLNKTNVITVDNFKRIKTFENFKHQHRGHLSIRIVNDEIIVNPEILIIFEKFNTTDCIEKIKVKQTTNYLIDKDIRKIEVLLNRVKQNFYKQVN